MKLGWKDIWKMEPFRLPLPYVRPIPTHLATCGMTDDPMCALCGRLIKPEARKPACLEALKDTGDVLGDTKYSLAP